MPAQPVPIERMIARSSNGKTLGGRDLEVNDVSAMGRPTPPPAPEGLGVRGTVEWEKIWTAGRWLWPDQDYHWVEQIARNYDDMESFRAEIRKHFEDTGSLTVDGYNGQQVAHPLIASADKKQELINKALSQLGFSPTDRARLKLTELKGASELQKLVNDGAAPNTVQGSVDHEYSEGEW